MPHIQCSHNSENLYSILGTFFLDANSNEVNKGEGNSYFLLSKYGQIYPIIAILSSPSPLRQLSSPPARARPRPPHPLFPAGTEARRPTLLLIPTAFLDLPCRCLALLAVAAQCPSLVQRPRAPPCIVCPVRVSYSRF